MANLLKKITLAAKNRTTYRVGMLQATAYRVLKQETAKILEPYGISTIEWAFLGLLYDYKNMRPKKAAEELGVEPPFVTTTFQKLEAKGLVSESVDPKDSRAKVICLTEKGTTFVETMEPIVRSSMRRLVDDIPRGDLLAYIAVLEQIIENSKKPLVRE